MTENFIDISPNIEGEVLKKIICEGVGEQPTVGCEVNVIIQNLTESTDIEAETTKVILGRDKICKGCEIALFTMKSGEKALIRCDRKYANLYNPSIKDSTIDFRLELLDWQYEDLSPEKDGSIRRKILTEGQSGDLPNDGALVDVHLIGENLDHVFDERDVSFPLGEGEEYDVVPGVDVALRKFRKGEKSRLFIKPKYGFSEGRCNKFKVPPDAEIKYEVTLESFKKEKDIWLMSDDEKVVAARLWKEKGDTYFKKGMVTTAITMYKRVVQLLKLFDDGRHIGGKEDEECEYLFFSAHMNLSLCYLKTEKYQEAKHSVNIARNLRPDNEKAHFRSGKVYQGLGDHRTALDFFQECLELNPDNKAALTELKNCSKSIKDHISQEKHIYGQMFDIFAKEDSQREKIEMRKTTNVMSSVGEWGAEDREREPSEFEKENPDIILLNKTGEFKDM